MKTTEIILALERAECSSDALIIWIAMRTGWGCEQDSERVSDNWMSPNGAMHHGLPDFMSSVDAASSLVPGNLRWSVESGPEAKASVWGPHPKFSPASGAVHESSPAIALCVAALMARLQMETLDRERAERLA